eukprot:gene25344-46356_t
MNGVRPVKNVSSFCGCLAFWVFARPEPLRWRTNQELPMPKSTAFAPSWDTSSFGHPADLLPLERSALAEHLSLCSRSRGPLQTLRNGAGLVRGFVAPRLMADSEQPGQDDWVPPPVRRMLDAARGPALEPIRSEIFGLARFEEHGRSLAA